MKTGEGRPENIWLFYLLQMGIQAEAAMKLLCLVARDKAGKEVSTWESSASRWYLKDWKEDKSPRESGNKNQSQSQGTKSFSSRRRSGKGTHRAESNEMIKN